MPIYKKKIKSGNVTEIYQYYSARKAGLKALPRRINQNTTPEEKQVLNIKESRLKLTRLINTNFSNNDTFIRLSYRKQLTDETALREFKKFMRRLRYYIKKNNLPELKYVAVTEKGKGKVHHHIVMNFTDINKIRNIWDNGGVYSVNLWSEDYEGLAMYITKETIRNEHGKRWRQSRNLAQPIIEVQELKHDPKGMPRVPKGHKLVESKCYIDSTGHKCWYIKTVKIE